VLGGWEGRGFDVGPESGESICHLCVQIGILFDEPRREAVEEARQVVCDQYLVVAAGPGADADGGDADAGYWAVDVD
jgi:hypothetical protein